ncbi:MAG: hypothetical protein RLZZ618_1356 [Pseudomonadota bacterium]|jgi:predicted DCC family thiol-disulfide oxidoreductase YuxK
MHTPAYPLTLLYDANCAVCALEMDALRERDVHGRLILIDISAAGFDATAFGTTLEALNAEIHAVDAHGVQTRGIAVLRLAYEAVGLGWVLRPTAWGPLRPLFDRGYRVFARHRSTVSRALGPLIQMVRGRRAQRLARQMSQCSQGQCRQETCAMPPRHEQPPV